MLAPIEPSVGEARQPRNRTLKGGDGQGPVWSSRGGDCRHDCSALVRPGAGFRVRAGPETSNAAPSGARRQARGTERVISPAPLLGRCGVIPQRWVRRRPLAGSDQGGTLLPLIRQLALMEAPIHSAIAEPSSSSTFPSSSSLEMAAKGPGADCPVTGVNA